MVDGVARRARRLLQGILSKRNARLLVAFVAVVLVAVLAWAAQGGGAGSQASPDMWNLATPEVTADGVEAQLSLAQLREAASIRYAIVRKASDGYHAVLTNIPASADESGMVSIPANPLVLSYTTNGDDTPILMGGFCEEAEDGDLHYKSQELRLCATIDLNNGYPGGIDVVSVDAVFDEAGELTQLGLARRDPVYPLGEIVEDDERGLYAGIFYAWKSSLAKTRAQDGTIAPVSAWQGGGTIDSEWNFCENGFDFRLSHLSAFENDEFYVQLIVEDAQGNEHASDISGSVLPRKDEDMLANTAEVTTKKGAMAFELGPDYATLVSYAGEDTELEVPAEVEGLPVEAIGDDALRYNEYVRVLALPPSVRVVGGAAFRQSAIERLALPAGLEHVGPGAFARMERLSEFTMEGQGKSFNVRDGVLLSADGKTLVAYPGGRQGSFSVPEGVRAIGYGAFAGSCVTHVEFPDSLREIGPYAFASCSGLESLELPDGLERIGSGAFDGYELANVTSVSLGPEVSYVGLDAFDGLATSSFGVDAKNRWYQSKDGFLLSAQGELLQAPKSLRGLVVVPEGVTGLAKGSLANILTGTQPLSSSLNEAEVYLPQSLEAIAEDALPEATQEREFGGSAQTCVAVRLHVPKGSWAEAYAQQNDIAYDNFCDAGNGQVEDVTVAVPKAEMSFKVYADHATLVSITAQDAGHVEVPAKVEGVPVTGVGDADSRDDEVSGNIITLILPSTIQSVEGNLIHSISSLRRISFAGNDVYALKDGMLFSADGSTLVACPAAYGDTIEVPEGTIEIGDYAFQGSQAASVRLPEGLERIGTSAFRSASNLTSIEFPQSLKSIGREAFYFSGLARIELNEGLQTIGKSAFCSTEGYGGLSIPDTVTTIGAGAFDAWRSTTKVPEPIGSDTLHIGAGVEEVYEEMFCWLDVQGFEVDERNDSLRAEGPFLLSADGRVLYACASGAQGEVRVPEGVEELMTYAFEAVPQVTDVYLPDSVVRAEMFLVFSAYTNEDLMLHCPEGSVAAALAEDAGINYTTT